MPNLATAAQPAVAAKNALELRNLNFFYGKFQGLKNVNMNIEERKVTAFIGPSGCGKSTLLRTLNRMYSLYPGQRAEGQINFYGQNILDEKQDINLLRARIGMVFQKPTPFPMSIYDNIAFGVKLYENLGKSEMDDRVEWALSKAALWTEVKDKLHQSGLGLSGGQQQRLCIARRHFFFGDQTAECLGDTGLAFFGLRQIKVRQIDMIASASTDLCDARTHLTCPDDADCTHFLLHVKLICGP